MGGDISEGRDLDACACFDDVSGRDLFCRPRPIHQHRSRRAEVLLQSRNLHLLRRHSSDHMLDHLLGAPQKDT